MNGSTQTGRWGERLRTAIAAFAVLVAGAFIASAPRLAHAAPAAGTVIGNQATATYNDAGGTPRTATSNLVQTTVSQVKSFTLTATRGAHRVRRPDGVLPAHHHQHRQRHRHVRAERRPTTGGAFAHTGARVLHRRRRQRRARQLHGHHHHRPHRGGGHLPLRRGGHGARGARPTATTGTITVSVSDTTPTTLTNVDTTTVANSAVSRDEVAVDHERPLAQRRPDHGDAVVHQLGQRRGDQPGAARRDSRGNDLHRRTAAAGASRAPRRSRTSERRPTTRAASSTTSASRPRAR